MSTNFKAYSKYYDLLYSDKNYYKESKYVSLLIRKILPDAHELLELGSGSGSHAFFFAEEGFAVSGIERSSEMVEESKTKNIPGFNPMVGDITDFHLDKKYEAVISLFHVISYLTENEDLLKCFRLTNKHLKENGLFVFDVWYSPAVYSQKPEARIKRMENDIIKVTRIAESCMETIRNVVKVNFEVNIVDKVSNKLEIIEETHPMRHFSVPEMDLLAKSTGFELLIAEEFLTSNAPSEKTWGVCFVLKKVNE